MNQQLSSFAARLRELIANRQSAIGNPQFSELALELFSLQFKHNSAYRKVCESRKLTPQVAEHWTQIPAVPTAAFKELDLTCLAPEERTTVFHSSGTTEQKPSRHFHNADSLALYESSVWRWFEANVVIGTPNSGSASIGVVRAGSETGVPPVRQFPVILLTPSPAQAPHSSLVHMFETVRQKFGWPEFAFTGNISNDGSWTVNFAATIQRLKIVSETGRPLALLGTAFSFVHLLDYLAKNELQFQLPNGSRVMETGGYKNRSRTMPKPELYALITERLGVSRENIISEYGMSELSSQAYDGVRPSSGAATLNMKAFPDFEGSPGVSRLLRPGQAHSGSNVFHFPPWARIQIISPETGRKVGEGETGSIRVFDLANVFSVAAIQTEDLGIRRGDGFELIGRAQLAEPRGCSLMTV